MHMSHNHGVIRFYAKGLSFENEDPFECSMSFFELSPKTIYIYNLLGKFKSNYFHEIEAELKDQGFDRVIAYFPTKFKPRGFMSLGELHEIKF